MWVVGGGVRAVRQTSCADCVEVAAMFNTRSAQRRRLYVRPLLRKARCEWCDTRLTPDVPALRRELAERADAVAGLRRDIWPRWLVARRKVSRCALLAIQDLAMAVMQTKPDEQLIRTDNGRPYLLRWWLHRPPADKQSTQAVYLRQFLRPDLPPPHDHPWDSAALVITGDPE